MSESVRAKLVQAYLLSEEGTWKIYGEDPNCDMGGHHHEPLLDTVKGRYEDIIEYALSLKNFIGWGAGGRIELEMTRVKLIPKGFTTQTLSKLYAERDELQKKLITIEMKISSLDVDYE